MYLGTLGRRWFSSTRVRWHSAAGTPPLLTSERLPHLQRNPHFARITHHDIAMFRRILQDRPGSLLSPLVPAHELPGTGDGVGAAHTEEDLHPFNTDWMGKYRGESQLVLKPRSTAELSEILKFCHRRRLAVVPQGGNTGLVGGSVPVFDEIVLSLQSMNQIRSFDSISGSPQSGDKLPAYSTFGVGVLVADAGCILETLDGYVGEHGYRMPLDLGAKGSCQIGGNVATNAGGLRLLRYGSLHGSVLGLEVVLADGTVLDSLSTLRKDNTGTDLKQLFIGSEGTLGVISAVSILTPKLPQSVHVAILGLESFELVQRAFAQSKEKLGEILSAFEFWDKAAWQLVRQHLSAHTTTFRDPLTTDCPFYVLVETAGSHKEHDEEKLSLFLEQLMDSGVVVDGALAQDESQAKEMWNIREGIPEACSKAGAVLKYDMSMPVPKLYQLVQDVTKRLQERKLYQGPSADWSPSADSLVNGIVGYGHIGDGNLHLNISAKSYAPELLDAVEPYVYEWVHQHQGSISAEHGLGLMKAAHIGYSKSPQMVEFMQKLKHLMDPHGILNPYKFLPQRR